MATYRAHDTATAWHCQHKHYTVGGATRCAMAYDRNRSAKLGSHRVSTVTVLTTTGERLSDGEYYTMLRHLEDRA